MAGELEEGETHTNQGSRGSEEEKRPPRARWVERVCGHLSDLYHPQHQVPPLPWPPAYQSQGVCCGDSGSLGVYQDQTQGSSKTAEMHVGIVRQQARQQCKARQKITLTSDSFPTPDIRTSHHICCHLSKFTGRSALPVPKPKGCLTHPRTLPGSHVCLFTACCTSLGKHLQLQFPKLEFGRRLIKTSISPQSIPDIPPQFQLGVFKVFKY